MKRLIHTLLLLLPLAATAQDVALCSGWLASVDENTQQIVLSWHPSPDSSAWGYHICTGTPCIDYDTVYGRMDTSYVCADHSPLEQHTYGLFVFDSNFNPSALTPHFGNMVLTAEVPECETTVEASWTPYVGMPEGRPRYTLWVRLEPFDADYDQYYTTSDSTALSYTFEMPESVTRAWLKVTADGEGGLRSLSNVISVERRTVERASFIEISHVEYDSINTNVLIDCHLDNSFNADYYTVYRSIDGNPIHPIGTFSTPLESYRFTDRNINPFDSLHCYWVGVNDACGMNEKRSPVECVVVPNPPPPGTAFPNVIFAGDPNNSHFLPVMRGLMGNLYELTIYNRQGLQVYHTENQYEGWTPTADTPQGVYVYHLRCRFNTGDIKNYTGTVTLIK